MAVALAVAACAPWQPDHSPNATLFPVEPRTGEGVVMWVIDETGLVTSARDAERLSPEAPPRVDIGEPGASARPELMEIDVRWFGGVCHQGPTVRLTGSPDALAIAVEPDAGPGPLFGMCPSVGVFYGVTLTLSAPITQETIEVREIR